MNLVPGAYGTDASNITGPFGMRQSQIRAHEICHNAGWYNKNGEKIGWGDLDGRDFIRIMEELPEGEFFIVLGEGDSYWDADSRPLSKTDPKEYMIQYARMIIQKDKTYSISDRNAGEESFLLAPRSQDRIPCSKISRSDARKLIG